MTSSTSNKIFLGFGILTILSGLSLIAQGNYLIGISGSIVGVWLFLENWKKIKGKNKE